MLGPKQWDKDYYSYDEGFRMNGKEYHTHGATWYGRRRTFSASEKDGILEITYYTRAPFKERPSHNIKGHYLWIDLRFYLEDFVNGEKFQFNKNYKDSLIVGSPQIEGVFRLQDDTYLNDWPQIHDGWISVELGDMHQINDFRFEFTVRDSLGRPTEITDGFVHQRDSDLQ